MPPPPPLYDGPAYTQYPREGQQNLSYQGQVSDQPPLAPVYATPQRGSSGRVWRRVGCIAGIVLLLILGICSAAGYFVYRGANNVISNVQQTATATGGYVSSNGVNDVTPTVGPSKTTTVGSTITYASNDMTIVNVQQAQGFADDNSSSRATGIARLNIKEQNTASRSANFLYSSVVRLGLPDGSQVEPLSEQNNISPDASVSRTNWLDFPVPTTVDPKQLTLIVGTADEAQMSVPLTGSADLAKYKPKTASPNKTFQHQGLNWTMTKAATSWSSTAVQAKKGMMYVTIDFKIDNPSSVGVSEYWNSYMRLKVGDVVSSPESSTNFPTDFPAGSSGKAASAIFLVPQGNTSYTFIVLPNSSGTVPQTSTDFQIK